MSAPTLTPPLVVDNPKPRLTHNQHVAERRTANILEATQMVTASMGSIDTMPPALAYMVGHLTMAIGEALQKAEDRGTEYPREVPELHQVFDYRPGTGPDSGIPPTHGLQCPHCGTVTWDGDNGGILVIDRSERWSSFSFEVLPDEPIYGPERRTADGWLPREVVGHGPGCSGDFPIGSRVTSDRTSGPVGPTSP